MKRIVLCVCVFALLGAALFAQTAATPAADFATQVNTDGTVTITGYKGTVKAVVIPEKINNRSVTVIGDGAFAGNPLTSVIIPNGVTYIGYYAFIDNQLTRVTIPNSVIFIGDGAFAGNPLTSVTIGNSVTIIGNDAFDGCAGLTSITIPASVVRIGAEADEAEDAFDGCTGLTSITVAGANGVYSSEDGVLFNKGKTTLLLYPEGKSGSYTIPSTVTGVAYCAFEGCARLTGVTIPDSVTYIGAYAFYGSQLTSVTIGNGVTEIGSKAFRDNQLTSVTIGANVNLVSNMFDWSDGVFDNGLDSDYYSNLYQAGTYTYTPDAWRPWSFEAR
jgi:hypothetical protein